MRDEISVRQRKLVYFLSEVNRPKEIDTKKNRHTQVLIKGEMKNNNKK